MTRRGSEGRNSDGAEDYGPRKETDKRGENIEAVQTETRSNILVVGGFDRGMEDVDKRKKIEHKLYEAGFIAEDIANISWGDEERGMAVEFRSKVVANTTFGRLKSINRLRAPAGEGTRIRRKEAGMKNDKQRPMRAMIRTMMMK